MQITLKLYANLGEYLPPGTRENAIQLDVPEEITAYTLIDRFQVPREMAHLVLLNGVYLHPEERDQPCLKEGDTIAVWPPVAGG